MRAIPELRDVNSDQQMKGLQTSLVIDRDTASRMGVNVLDIDNTLGDAFGQRQVSNIYKGLNQYHVVMEVAPEAQQGPAGAQHDLCAIKQREIDSVERVRALRAIQYRAIRESPGRISGHHAVIQSGARRFSGSRGGTHSGGATRTGNSHHRARHVSRHRASLSGFSVQRSRS